jgi:FkbM family methyltransferase
MVASALVSRVLDAAGLTVSRVKPAGSPLRPVGDLRSFLEDVHARGLAPTHIVDVGAHKGDWSRVAHRVWPRARFTLIEPQVEMRPYIEAFTAHASARWIQAGAADTVGEATLTVNPDPTSSTFALTAEEAAERSLSERRIVPVVTLDAVLAEDEGAVPELVKLDVEELELAVLRGAERYFGVTELFIVEASLFNYHGSTSKLVELIAFMADQGYMPYDFCGFSRRPLDGALGLTDVAFARETGLLRSQTAWTKRDRVD